MTNINKGKLVCVGTGMKLGADLTPIARKYIEHADVLYSCVSSGIVELWLEGLNSNVISLQPYYQEGKSRLITYKEMVSTIIQSVKQGQNVCAAFYGHPGVFAWVAHKAIAKARELNSFAKMIPGLSAEDYLYADLGIDPGTCGCQHYEASQIMFKNKQIDTSSLLIIWQVGVAGDKSLSRFSTSEKHREVLVDMLAGMYSLDHNIILYEVATLPIEDTRIEYIRVEDLINATVSLKTTVIIPPIRDADENSPRINRLKTIDKLYTLSD